MTEKTQAQRVQWIAASKTFQVTYASADGKTHRSIRGLKVGTKDPADPAGGPLQGSPYRRVFAVTMEKAKQSWNALDMSEGERFSLSEDK